MVNLLLIYLPLHLESNVFISVDELLHVICYLMYQQAKACIPYLNVCLQLNAPAI